MQERLKELCFLPPPTGASWHGPPREQDRYELKRSVGTAVLLDLPLFWNEPYWYRTAPQVADMVATAVAGEGVLVSALYRDLTDSVEAETVTLVKELDDDSEDQAHRQRYLPRIVPYRPERYGLSAVDFDGARIIDVRLRVCGDWSGRFAYSAGQIGRWEGDPQGDPPAGGSWAPAGTFPPDVPALDQLERKLDQLRQLSPDAAIFVSITPHRLDAEIPVVLAAKPDGLILDLNELPLSGMQLGQLTRHARRLLSASGAAGFPLWLVPGEITPDDAVKLVVLGASGVAIDHWCRDLIELAEETIENSPAARLGQEHQRDIVAPLIESMVRDSLSLELERFRGLLQRMRCLSTGERLGSLDRTWASTFEVPWVALGRTKPRLSTPTNTDHS